MILRHQMTMKNALPVFAAIVTGFVLLPAVDREYDRWASQREHQAQVSTPVVKMTGKVIRREGADVWLHITGEKLRECRYAGLSAYSIDASGVRRDANIERADGIVVRGESKPPGVYDLGVWRVWPVMSETATVMVAVDHLCDGISVRSIIAEVRL